MVDNAFLRIDSIALKQIQTGVRVLNMDTWAGVAQTILDGFNRHYSHFRQYSREGKECFERADWPRSGEVSAERILGYEQRVQETVEAIECEYPAVSTNNELWPRIKIVPRGCLAGE